MLTGKQAVWLLDEKRWPLCEMLGHYKAFYVTILIGGCLWLKLNQSSEEGICIAGKLDILENY